MKAEKTETFEEVAEKIKGERSYQDTVVSKFFAEAGKDGATDETRSIAAEILMMDKYVHTAQAAWMHLHEDDTALHAIRKVAALAIRCLETHGCPERTVPKVTGKMEAQK